MTREYNYAGGQNELVSYSNLADLEITKHRPTAISKKASTTARKNIATWPSKH